jgi:transposase
MTSPDAVTTEDLRDALAEVEGKKPTQRLMAAINYLEEDDATMAEVANRYGYTGPWLSRWLERLDRLAYEPVEQVVYDEPREGRPTALSDAEYEQFVKTLHESPEVVGFDAPAWSVPLARQYLQDQFDVEYSERHVRRLLSEAGLSWKTARPEYHKSDERAQEAWQEGFKKSATIWTMSTRSSQSIRRDKSSQR